ncbi:putative replication factor C subunit 2 [Emiliania huxleyi CCMP1516]|uniref:AAA+ ATPase domain-containing protein n=3 Tax=Emiliania huxleyi TaxID=2903 RepID=A0A0D3IDK4_EMIH1|nr:putative replication factor C subunit 2 [Emiliania huxleyi CCMP1516]EOD09339.1 putative replication factor C subunit 2 [Emiliania huxleyi CCMP1516]|eukprot:XP_005761768.1 putative replication factor C subunit 2 [Emiliania huxleyi CCMP1516]
MFGAPDTSSVVHEQPWLEKYRPREVKDIVGNEDTVGRIAVLAAQGNMPNLILSGPPGTGKTTSVLALARALLGDAFKEAVLELNASDDRGIDVVRNRIKSFAQKKVTLPPGRHKIVVLDEADSMTEGAQQAMRRTMEIYSATTRFALACNQSDKIIEPIQSRCAILRYGKLSDQQVVTRLTAVLEAEGAAYDEGGIEAVVFTAEGDMRQALNNAQATTAGFGIISNQNVFKVCDQPHPVVIKRAIAACIAADFDAACSAVEELSNNGYSGMDVVGTLFKLVKFEEMDEGLKLDFIKEIGAAHMRVLDGMDTLLQLTGLIGKLCLAAQQRKGAPRG